MQRWRARLPVLMRRKFDWRRSGQRYPRERSTAWRIAAVRSLSLLRLQNRIALDVDPVVCFCGLVATQAILLIISCNLRAGCIGLEECPTPPISPQGVVWVAAFCILDQDKPDFG